MLACWKGGQKAVLEQVSQGDEIREVSEDEIRWNLVSQSKDSAFILGEMEATAAFEKVILLTGCCENRLELRLRDYWRDPGKRNSGERYVTDTHQPVNRRPPRPFPLLLGEGPSSEREREEPSGAAWLD